MRFLPVQPCIQVLQLIDCMTVLIVAARNVLAMSGINMTIKTLDHEVITAFAGHGDSLADMLNEHYSHCTERRGGGYTQATRVLAGYANQTRAQSDLDDWNVFAEPPLKSLRWVLAQAGAHGLALDGWRHLDRQPQVSAWLAQATVHDEFYAELAEQVRIQRLLRSLPDELEREESRILVQMLVDLLLPCDALAEGLLTLPAQQEKPKIGSCTLAEKFFLEIVHEAFTRKGRINIVVDGENRPLLLEKLRMGDSHSCISLRPLMMNGVRIPASGLFAAALVDEHEPPLGIRPCRHIKGQIIPVADYAGFRFLRLTTLAVSPANRERAFSAHFTRQAETGMFGYATARIDQFMTLAQNQL